MRGIIQPPTLLPICTILVTLFTLHTNATVAVTTTNTPPSTIELTRNQLDTTHAAAPIYAAAFLTQSSHTSLAARFLNVTQPCPSILSNQQKQALNVPVAPASLYPPAILTVGQEQELQVLAVARDEYVQTALVAQSLGTPQTTTLQLSSQTYPSILLSRTADSTLPNFSRVSAQGYSQVLWSRLVNQGVIQLTRDAGPGETQGRIMSVTLVGVPQGQNQVTVILPATLLDPQTIASVTLIPPSSQGSVSVDAQLCSNATWTGSSCLIAPWPPAPVVSYPDTPIAAWLDGTSSATLTKALVEDPCKEGWDTLTIADHSTIEFAPSDPHAYDPFLGQKQEYSMLVFARCEQLSAVLLTLTSSLPAGSTPVYSKNYYSHSTVRAMALGGPYGAVYSNTFFTRLENASIISVQRDSNGHILSAGLVGTNETSISATLPAWNDQEYEMYQYPPTNVFVSLLDPTKPENALEGIVCLSSFWDDTSKVCNVPPSGASSTSSPSPTGSSSTGSGGAPDSNPSDPNKVLKIGLGVGGGIVLLVAMVACCKYCHLKAMAAESSLDAQLLSTNAPSGGGGGGGGGGRRVQHESKDDLEGETNEPYHALPMRPSPRSTRGGGIHLPTHATSGVSILCMISLLLLSSTLSVRGQQTPPQDTCATDLVVHTTPGSSPPSAPTEYALALWNRNYYGSTPGGPTPADAEVIWKLVPVQQDFEYGLSVGSGYYYQVILGNYGGSWSTSDWTHGQAEDAISITVSDVGGFTTQATVQTGVCSSQEGGPKGCTAYTIVCAVGSSCMFNLTIIRSEQSGIWMEALKVEKDSTSFFLPNANEVIVSLVGATEYKVGALVDQNIRDRSTVVHLGSYNEPMGSCNDYQYHRPPATEVIVDLTHVTVAINGPLDPHGNECGTLVESTKGCTNMVFNYTQEVAAMAMEDIAVWIVPTGWEQGGTTPPAGDRPTVWRKFTCMDQMISFAYEEDLLIGIVQFPELDRNPREYLRSPIYLAANGETWITAVDSNGMGTFTPSSDSGDPNSVTILPQSGGQIWWGKTSYWAMYKGNRPVYLTSTMSGFTTMSMDQSKIYFRGDSSFTELAPIQNEDLNNAEVGFPITEGAGDVSMFGVMTIEGTGGLSFAQFTPAQACDGQTCSGHGTCSVSIGYCVCDGGWTGASCAEFAAPVSASSSSSSTGGGSPTPPPPPPPTPGTSTGGSPTPTSGSSTGSTPPPAPIVVASSSTGPGSAGNGTLPPPPILPGVQWSTAVGLGIAASHVAMGVALPSWSFRAAMGFFQLSALLSHSGVQLPDNVRSLSKQLDMLNFQLRNPNNEDLPSQEDSPGIVIVVNVTESIDGNRRLLQQQQTGDLTPDAYAAAVRAHSDVFLLTFLSVLGVLGFAWTVCAVLLAFDRGLHGPFVEHDAMVKLAAEVEIEEDLAAAVAAAVNDTDAKETKGKDLLVDEESPSPASLPLVSSCGSLDHSLTGGEVEVDKDKQAPSSKALLPTVLWFLRTNSASYRVHLRSLPLCLTLHLLKLSYYGLAFSSFRHVAWFEHEHTSPFITMLAWVTVLACTFVAPIIVVRILNSQHALLEHQESSQGSSLSRAKVRLFSFTYSSILDGPLRPTRRRWALWIILRRVILAGLLGVLAVNTVQSEHQWGMDPDSATSVQLGLCFAVQMLYFFCIVLQKPYASDVVNRLQLVYEGLSCGVVLSLLIYHDHSTTGWIDFVLFLNFLAALVSFSVFGLMVWELSRPWHGRLGECFNSCCGGETSRNREEEEALGQKQRSDGDGVEKTKITTLAHQLFPNMDAEVVVPGKDLAPYSSDNPPPLPIKRRPKKIASPSASSAVQPVEHADLAQSLL